MSASEAVLYRALGTFSLAGQTSPMTIIDPVMNAGYEVIISLKQEGGTLSGVSVQNITKGSFQVVFNNANDSVYTYFAMPNFNYFDSNPTPSGGTTRTIAYTAPSTQGQIDFGQTLSLGSYSIDGTRTCTNIVLSFNMSIVAVFLPVGGVVGMRIKEGASVIASVEYSTFTAGYNLWQLTNNHFSPTLFSTTGTTRTFTLELYNSTGTGGQASAIVYPYPSPPLDKIYEIMSANLVASYSP